MKRQIVMKSSTSNSRKSNISSASYTQARINRFTQALANAVKIYYQLDEESQSEIDSIIGEDFIVDLEDCVKALSFR